MTCYSHDVGCGTSLKHIETLGTRAKNAPTRKHVIAAYRPRFPVYILGNVENLYLLTTNMGKGNVPTLYPFADGFQTRDRGVT
jgi:hypothetical protein